MEDDAKDLRSLPKWDGILSEKIVPVMFTYMRTTHTLNLAELERRAPEGMKQLPPEVRDMLMKDVAARFMKETGGKTLEHHWYLLAHDKEAGKCLVLAAHVGEKNGKIETDGAQVLDDEEKGDDMWRMALSVKASATTMRHIPDWKGERDIFVIEEDITGIEDMETRISKNGLARIFDAAFNMAGSLPAMEVQAAPESVDATAKKRAALVAKFGEDKVQEMEARIAARTRPEAGH